MSQFAFAPLWICLHFLSSTLLCFAFIAGLLYLYKHADKKTFLKTIWTVLAIGFVGSVLTAGLAASSWHRLMDGRGDWDRSDMGELMEDMMDNDEDAE